MAKIYKSQVKRRDAAGWKRGEGPYSSSKDFRPDRPDMWGVTPTPAGRTMGGTDVNGGFSGGLGKSGTSGAPSWAGGKSNKYYAR